MRTFSVHTIAFALVIVAMFSIGCSRPAIAADVVKVVISGKACANCADAVTIERDGKFSLGDSASAMSVMDPTRAKEILDSIPVDELRGRPPALSAAATLGVGLWTAYRDGTQDYAVVNVGQSGVGGSGKLHQWLVEAAFESTQIVMGSRRAAIQSALTSRTLRSVQLDMLGCYGTCPRYSVKFGHNGDATFHSSMPSCISDARAHLPFALVIDAMSRANAPNLWPSYPRRITDSEAARITLDTVGGRIISDGPDKSTWDRTFASAQGRLDEIVRMLDWNPKLDLAQCSRSSRARRQRVEHGL